MLRKNLVFCENDKSYKRRDIWFRAIRVTLKVIKFVDGFPKKSVGFVVSNQIIKSSTSVGANISEAGVAYSRKEFANFMNIARREAVETDYWLRIAICSNLGNRNLAIQLGRGYNEIIKILSSVVKKVQNRKF